MHFFHPRGLSRFALSAAVLGLLLTLLLMPGEVQGQTAPTITGGATTKSFAENTPTTEVIDTYTASDDDAGDMLSWSVEGNDSGDFEISSTGELTFAAEPDFEIPADTGGNNVYNVTVVVSDDEDPPMTAERAVTITVTNVDEAGTVAITGMEKGGAELTAAVTDLDGTVSDLTWQWSSSTTSNGTFTDISGAISNKYTSVAADVGKYLKATATYKDPESTTVDKMAEAVTSGAIAANNNEPAFPSSETGTRSVNENAATNMDIGAAFAATDDDDDTLTYGLTGTDAGSFNFDTSTGQIETKSALDHETTDSYSVTVTVRDSKDAAGDDDMAVDDTITVTITVNNVNDEPTITTSITTKNVDENTTAVLSFAATDADASTTLS